MFTGAADELFASWDSGVPWGLNFSIPLAIDDDAPLRNLAAKIII
jgi:hypothetical protein